MMPWLTILSHTALAQIGNLETAGATDGVAKTTYQLARLSEFDDARLFVLGLVAVVVVLLFVVWSIYRRDTAELRPWVAHLCLGLRIGAIALLVLFFLQPQRRTERKIVRNSRVLVLVDVSQSMGLQDGEAPDGTSAPSRIEKVVSALRDGSFLNDVRKEHDVILIRFDRDTHRVISLAKLDGALPGAGSETPDDRSESAASANSTVTPSKEQQDDVWQKQFIPQGTETRIGDAIRSVIQDQQGGPVSAIVMVTDGAQNGGIAADTALKLARDAGIPIFTVGMGADRQPKNVRLSDFNGPPRAFPNDSFTLTGLIQAVGLKNRAVDVELYSRRATESAEAYALTDSQRLTLGAEGEMTPVTFELSADAPGRYTYELRIAQLAEDRNPTDNRQEVDVEIVTRKNRVLLWASGPSREYRFLRNQLRRDKDVVVDVLLQSAQGAISQDADELLSEFPRSKEDLFEYDCIVAFDPDWTALDAEQIELLEKWVADQAGGLILIAGPIHTGKWRRSSSLSTVLALYPVEFQRRFTTFSDADFGRSTAWPLAFTREGLEAEFLWLDDTAVASESIWDSFDGVYGYYAVKGAKPGATVYGRFGDSEAGIDDQGPVYFAGQFYGSGRVFYAGSGEMWRLRELDDAYFEQFYTKLIRHVSQGRLMRGSSRGSLLVERDRYLLGDTVVVRARLADELHEPLDVPGVSAQVVRPDSTTFALQLEPDAARKGMYRGQFTALQEGTFRVDLATPGVIDEPLSSRVQIKVPDLEREHARRNDPLLSKIAASTGGIYYVGIEAAMGTPSTSTRPILTHLVNREEITTLVGAPDRDFDRQVMRFMLWGICGLLCCEWLVRRLSKLA